MGQGELLTSQCPGQVLIQNTAKDETLPAIRKNRKLTTFDESMDMGVIWGFKDPRGNKNDVESKKPLA